MHNILINQYFEESQPAVQNTQDEEIQPVVQNTHDSQMGAEEIDFSVLEREINKIYDSAKAKGLEEREKTRKEEEENQKKVQERNEAKVVGITFHRFVTSGGSYLENWEKI